MKVISLNTWGGRGGMDGLLTFFRDHNEVDIFCLQEVWNGGEEMVGKIGGGVPLVGVETDLLSRIARVLPEHVPYFRPHFHEYYGLAMLVRNTLPVASEEECVIYKEPGFISEEDPGNHTRIIQAVTFGGDAPNTVAHLHGLWQPMPKEVLAVTDGKQDNPDRIEQSRRIVSFTQTVMHPFVLLGDFNLLPDSESIAMLERAGMRNLIKEYGIEGTRTSLYTKPGRFADYAFVSEGITVHDFAVLPDEVSDHAPLYLEYSLT
jgi:exonuclease III